MVPAYGFRTTDLFRIRDASEIRWLDSLPYEKGTLLNRILIPAANGPTRLSIPVRKWAKGTPVSEIQIDYTQKWKHQHLRTIQSAYGKAPYFPFLKDDLAAHFEPSPHRLIEFTKPFQAWLLDQLLPLVPKSDSLTQITVPVQPGSPNFLSYNSDIRSDKSGQYVYAQVFGGEFVPDVSVLDLLFCDGPKFWKLQN